MDQSPSVRTGVPAIQRHTEHVRRLDTISLAVLRRPFITLLGFSNGDKVPEQLSFASSFEEAAFEQRTSQLPSAMEGGIAFCRSLIDRFNAVLLVSDMPAAEHLIEEAHDLATKLNGGDLAIFADENSAGNILERETAAKPGDVPLWGQTGQFVIEPVVGMKVLIEMEGILGIPTDPVPSFAAHALDPDKPFISETGYRSFIGWRFPLKAGANPPDYAKAVIQEHIRRHLKGRLTLIEPTYRARLRQSGSAFSQDAPELA